MAQELIARTTAQGRWVLASTVLGSGIALLDGTVVNIALQDMGEDLDATISELQWVVNAYLLSLASLILVGGGLGDRLGRRRMYLVGVSWFAVASVLCAVAQDPLQLIFARLLQGIGGALLTPGSLAMIQSTFRVADRPRVIGQWAGLGGIAAAVGPLLGGWLIDQASWRWIFWINVPIALVVVVITVRHAPETRDPSASGRFDLTGAAAGVLGLGGITYALIELGRGLSWPVVVTGGAGVLALAGFVAVERRVRRPLVPLRLFGSRVFAMSNAMTFLVYGALGAVMFFLVLQLQVSSGFSPLRAGLSTVPITVALLLLSSRSAALAARIGPRTQMSLGPVLCAVGTLLLAGVDAGSGYLVDVLPGISVFALGLATLVAPLTSTVLAAVPDRFAGVASGINNAVARTGSLLAVAAVPTLVGLSGEEYQDPGAFTDAYRAAMVACCLLLVAGGVVSYLGLRVAAEPAGSEPVLPGPSG